MSATAWQCTLVGAPRTKKNHGRLVKAGAHHKMLPSEAYEEWVKDVVFSPQLSPNHVWSVVGAKKKTERERVPSLLASRPYNVTAVFYRHANVGDAVGYYQGLADLLEHWRVVDDDKWIVSWDGSRLAKDAARPRVEVTLTAVAP